MILDFGAHSRSVPDFSISFQGALCLLQSSNRFTTYSFHAIELELRRVILDISPHNRSTSDFSIHQRGAVGARFLKSSDRFTAYSSYSIELNLDRIILDISPQNLAESDFPNSPQWAMLGRAS